MTIVAAITELASVLESNTDAKKAHEYPPESLSETPCFVIEIFGGTLDFATAGELSSDNITVEVGLYFTRQEIRRSSQKVRPFIASVRDALWANASLNREAEGLLAIRFEGPGEMRYGRKKYFGIRFELDYKFKESVTFEL